MQRTSSEMRISDLSSAVYSSVLFVTFQLLPNLLRQRGEIGLGRDAFVVDAVYVDRAGVDLALGIDVAMEVVLRRPAIAQLDAADLDDAMADDRKSTRLNSSH